MPDAVVIGSGPNGLVGANVLADAGWDVLVLEAQDEPGGSVRSGTSTLPGYVHDRFSSFYPLGAASPALRALDLEAHGLRWRRHEIPVAHPDPEGRTAYVGATVEETCAALEQFAPGDGDGWRRLYALWEQVGDDILDALVTPMPPVVPVARMVRRLGPRGMLDLARFGVLSVRRLGDEEFHGEGGPRLLAGNALHADFTPESAGGAMFGFVLCGLAQQVGYPIVEGGSGGLPAALIRRLESRGGRVQTGARVQRIEVRRGRAVAVRTAGGDVVEARRAVLASAAAPQLYLELLGEEHVPARVLQAIRRFEWDNATVKADWALSGPIPWTAEATRRAGTVHVTPGVDALTRESASLAQALIPAEPFLVAGQYASADPTRQPAGAESFYAYAHVPQRARGDAGGDGLTGRWDARELDVFVDRMEAQVEAMAPGFRSLVRARSVMGPREMQAANQNLVNGALNGGTANLHQELVFRPVPGLGRAETPVAGLYLASASAHPGGGVHGACGHIAARTALRQSGPVRRLAAGVAGAATGRGRPGPQR